MNIIYISREHLYVIKKDMLSEYNLTAYFSCNKHTDVFVESEDGILLGYINDQSFKKSCNLNPFPYSVKQIVYNDYKIHRFFCEHPNNDSLPVIDKAGKLKGAFIRNYPEELRSYNRIINQMAINTLFAFSEDFLSYISQLGYESVYIKCDDIDYCVLHSMFPSFIRYNIDEYPSSGKKLLIDLLYSKSYRKKELSQLKKTDVFAIDTLLSASLIGIVDKYVRDNGGFLYYFEGPIKEKLDMSREKWPQLYSEITFGDAVGNVSLLKRFYNNDTKLLSLAQAPKSSLQGGSSVTTNGIHLIMSDRESQRNEFLEININGERQKRNNIHLYGSCLTYGACVQRDQTISAYLQKKIDEQHISYTVVNNGVKNGHSILNDLLYILNTHIMPGDILMEINSYEPLIEYEISRKNKIYDISNYYNLNCQSENWEFLDNTFHVNSSVNKSIANYLLKFIGKNIGRTKQVQAHDNYFFTSGKISKLNPTWLLEKGLLNSYLTYLSTNKKILDDKSIIGSVIITANPITKGHEFLINEAKKQCDILYVFVVEEDRFFFSTTERLFMVKQTIKDPNIVVLTTGNLMTASFTFPEYFNKEHAIPQKDNKTIPQFHFQIFGTIVAPLLGINVRFIGSEIEDSVTDVYNKMLMKYLPPMGIKVILIPRMQTSDKQIISASTVRKCIESRNLDALSHYVSPAIMDLIQNKWDKKEY